MEIKRIEFKSSLLEDKNQASEVPVHSWKWKDIPQDLKDLLKADKPWELSGSYGDPSVAIPIEYKKATFIGSGGSKSIEFFNLGTVFFLSKNTEELRRIYRCLVQFDDMCQV